MIDLSESNPVALPDKYTLTLPAVNGSGDALRFHILPGSKTGVVRLKKSVYSGTDHSQIFVDSFAPEGFFEFQTSIAQSIAAFKDAGVTRLLLDLTGNGGGFVCLGQFLHQYLAGSSSGYPYVLIHFYSTVLTERALQWF